MHFFAVGCRIVCRYSTLVLQGDQFATCADFLRSSIDYPTLDKRKKGGWVLGFEFLALSFLDKNESLDALVVVA